MLFVSVNLKNNALRENVISYYVIDENNTISMMLTCKNKGLDLGLGLILVGSFEKGKPTVPLLLQAPSGNVDIAWGLVNELEASHMPESDPK